jgi:putative spermidine/putrescine transport system permease protein
MRQQILGSSIAVTIGMTQILLPFAVLPMVNRMRAIDPDLICAAKSLGAKPRAAFNHVFLPLSIPGVAAGALTVYIMAIGFYLAPALLGSPSDSLLSQTLYQQVALQLNFGRGGALTAVLIALLLIAAGLLASIRLWFGAAGRSVGT